MAESQEAKLKKVRALKGHVEQKRLSNGRLGESGAGWGDVWGRDGAAGRWACGCRVGAGARGCEGGTQVQLGVGGGTGKQGAYSPAC